MTRVPPAGGLAISSRPPSAVTRSAIPTRPWPLASAPPIPSSEISTRSAPSATLVRTAARVREKDAVTRRWQPRMGNDERALGVAD